MTQEVDGPADPAPRRGQPGDIADEGEGLAVRTLGLSKRFGRQFAVDRVDLAVPRGAVFGFLGPNGSGKTTTLRVLLGLANASSGQMWLLGHDVPRSLGRVLPRVGALIEGPAFYPFLSGAANLERYDSADPRTDARTRSARVARALDRVGLGHAAGKKAKAYSLGMRQRLGIATALLVERDLLVLDEPTNGLDPQGTREVRNLIRSLAGEGTTVLVSSHLLAEVQQICTHAAIMRAGAVVAQGTLEDLRGGAQPEIALRTPDPQRAVEVLRELGFRAAIAGGTLVPGARDPGTSSVGAGPAGMSEATLLAQWVGPEGMPEPPAEDVVAGLVLGGVRVRGFTSERPSLEERFVALTGEGFDVAQ